MKASWKTSGAGIATIVVGVGNLIISIIQNKTVTSEAAGIAVTAVIAGIGLMNAKDNNVSNSPTPLSSAQAVTDTQAALAAVKMPSVQAAAIVSQVVESAVTGAAKPAETTEMPTGSHKF